MFRHVLFAFPAGRGAVGGGEGLRDRSIDPALASLVRPSVVTVLIKAVRSAFSLGFTGFRTVGPWGLMGLGPLVLG